MKFALICALVLSSLACTSFGSVPSSEGMKEYRFKYLDLDSKKLLLEKSISARSPEEALDKAATSCFAELRKMKVPGIDAIDICVNPRS